MHLFRFVTGCSTFTVVARSHSEAHRLSPRVSPRVIPDSLNCSVLLCCRIWFRGVGRLERLDALHQLLWGRHSQQVQVLWLAAPQVRREVLWGECSQYWGGHAAGTWGNCISIRNFGWQHWCKLWVQQCFQCLVPPQAAYSFCKIVPTSRHTNAQLAAASKFPAVTDNKHTQTIRRTYKVDVKNPYKTYDFPNRITLKRISGKSKKKNCVLLSRIYTLLYLYCR